MAAGALAALLLGMPAGGEPDFGLAREEYPVVDGCGRLASQDRSLT